SSSAPANSHLKNFYNFLKDSAGSGDYKGMKRITSAIKTKLLAVALLLLMLGFTPAFGQVNPLQPASKPALKKPVHTPSAVHRRKHRRHRRRRIRRVRR